MRILEVVLCVVVGQTGGLCHNPVGFVAQCLQCVVGQQLRHQQEAVLVIEVDLLLGHGWCGSGGHSNTPCEYGRVKAISRLSLGDMR